MTNKFRQRLATNDQRPLSSCLCWVLLFCCTLAQIGNAQEAKIPSGPYRIAGTVVSAKGSGALALCRVTITDSKTRKSTQTFITGDDGRFEFHVPAGKFSLEGAKRGFITAAYNQHEQFSTAIVTGADLESESLVLRLAPNPVLAGKILDENGDPVRNARITVYRHDQSMGVSRTYAYRAAMTDDQGRYEVTPIDEGVYFVSAEASPWYEVHPAMSCGHAPCLPTQVDSSLDVAYPVTYYGDATEPDDAIAIPVRGGERLEADIHFNPVPALHLIVHVPEGGIYPRLYKPSFDGAESMQHIDIQGAAPGVMEFTGIAAGRYIMRALDSDGKMKEPIEVSLNSSGEFDASPGRSTSKIKAAVQMEGGASIPAQTFVELSNRKGKRSQVLVDEKGEANFADVIPGVYDVLASSPTQRYSVVRIASEAGSASGHALTVPPGASLTLLFSLVGGVVKVEGFAKRNEKAASGAMIVLVPKNAEADRDRFRRDQSDLDGSFSLANVIPGSYIAIAIEDGWDLDWAEPAVLAQYLKRGQTIEVGDQPPIMHLPDAVQVQTK
jgi:protocatechuate 3,4-dioxygenase beta subunit